MTAIYAKPNTPPVRNVLFVAYHDIVLLDLVGPLQVFTHAREAGAKVNAYQTHVLSAQGGQVETNTILPIPTEPLDHWLSSDANIHTVIIVGGDGALPATHDPKLVDDIAQLANRAKRVCSICSGALLLAATGLLDGRRAVTHWEDCDDLTRLFPLVRLEIDPIFVKDGKFWTSAGITAGIDMALSIIEEDLGKQSAINMARSLVTPMMRAGGQSQFSPELNRQARDTTGRFTALHDWIKSNITTQISVEDMAEFCGMSPRNFSRRYSQIIGLSPAKAIEIQRIDIARDLLMTTQNSIQSIARDSGFQDVERMRRAFLRTVHTSPMDYRKLFQAT
ncbi:helix-turn-helix domain-containing protein [Planktotalea sp.]|uniref:GlxA family transcriptional regulator n=1 Tax=Planktotalea sp. TaxID=2029877 RepID=UPI0032998D8E